MLGFNSAESRQATDILPHRTTILNKVSKRVADLKGSIMIPDMKKYVNV
jgi:hypothetical protein